MRIVDVTQWYAATSGGIRTYLHAKADWAERVGIEHAIVVPGPVAGQSTVAASQLVSLRGRTLSERWGYRMVVRPRPIVDALDELEPDIVVTHDVMGFPSTLGRWAAARGIPLAMFCHSNAAAAVA